MVPPTLVKRWTDGINATVPFADVHVVNNLEEFMAATKDIKNPNRVKPLWIIMSENTAKINYDEHPGVIWDEQKKCYVCPHCGRPILIEKTRSDDGGLLRGRPFLKASLMDFLKKDEKNAFCRNVMDDNGMTRSGCGEALWTAATKKNSQNWIKIDQIGWMPIDRIKDFQENIEYITKNLADGATKTYRKTMKKYQEALSKYDIRGAIARYPNRYSIAHYIRKHMNHCFDYLIADEVHQLEGDSQQGRAFGTIVSSVWRSIFLTGTLSNGYAGGLFHLLFRTQTRKMLEMGYTIEDEAAFADAYGVKQRKVIEDGYLLKGRQANTFRATGGKKTKTKRLPGISPTLVADFLMNSFVSVRKSDISNKLCPYEEIPVGVDKDPELEEAYKNMVQEMQVVMEGRGMRLRSGRQRIIRNALLTATMFLDQPYGLDVVRRDNYKRIELSDKVIRNKEEKLVDIVKKHKEKGEKMLIYVEYTNKLEIADRLKRILKKNDINAECMTTKIKQNHRQEWLEDVAKKGNVDAIILNPSLVEVGMNLLDYTTIIFYEIGTKIMTVRQASQRSNRINQTKPVTVYFMYYKDSIQEDTLGAISQKLTASKAVEGDFSESALQKMADDTDILTKLVNSLVKDEHIKVESKNFEHSNGEETKSSFEDMSKDIAAEPKHMKRSCFDDRPKFNLWGVGDATSISFRVS